MISGTIDIYLFEWHAPKEDLWKENDLNEQKLHVNTNITTSFIQKYKDSFPIYSVAL